MSELSLFGDEFNTGGAKRTPKGGSGNPIVFHDYESYIAKFRDQAKTTGIFTEICKFYSASNIPFFLFGPGLTIGTVWKYCGTVFISENITFENGAVVKCNFATNLVPDIIAMTAPDLGAAISACKSQQIKANLPRYKYPDNVLSVSDLHSIARGDTPFTVKRSEAEIIRDLDYHPKKGGLFGDHLLISTEKAKEKEKEKEKRKLKEAINISLSPREKRIIERLDSTE